MGSYCYKAHFVTDAPKWHGIRGALYIKDDEAIWPGIVLFVGSCLSALAHHNARCPGMYESETKMGIGRAGDNLTNPLPALLGARAFRSRYADQYILYTHEVARTLFPFSDQRLQLQRHIANPPRHVSLAEASTATERVRRRWQLLEDRYQTSPARFPRAAGV
eukprot:GHVO01065469.1.p1 GENE.GHVO01065469.1~~GHVO01065469.1.p1  ORF type:complete len:163 (+),score=7.82 GHVO01065469.1:152-640(+)